MRVSVAVLKFRVQEWLEAVGISSREFAWYTKDEWIARNESVGLAADLTLVSENRNVYDILSGGDVDDDIGSHWNRLIELCGYYCIPGYSWSFHFYQEEEGPPPPIAKREYFTEIPF